MKRIYNDIPVRSICYAISGLQRVRIVDYDNWERAACDNGGKVVCEGLLKDIMSGYDNWKYFACKCHGIKLDGDVMVFSIVSRWEEF